MRLYRFTRSRLPTAATRRLHLQCGLFLSLPDSALTSTTASHRTYATAATPTFTQPKAPSVLESNSQIAAHLAEHPEKLDYMIKVVSQQLGSIQEEIKAKGADFEPAEAAAVLNALGSTVDTLLPAVSEASKKEKLQGLVDEIRRLRGEL